MHGKEFWNDLIRSYFTLVTLITAATLVLGLSLEPDVRFGYEAFASPLIFALCGVVPNVVMYSKKELTIKELLVRKLLQLILIEILVLLVAFYGTEQYAKTERITAIGISIFVIYIITHIIDWFLDYRSAKKMNEELIRFQQTVK